MHKADTTLYKDNVMSDVRIGVDKGDRSSKVDMWLLFYFEKARELRISKDKDYNSSWRDLGAKGLFVRITDKYNRIKSLFWNGNVRQVADEKLRDTVIDMINYLLYFLYCIDHGMEEGDNPEA